DIFIDNGNEIIIRWFMIYVVSIQQVSPIEYGHVLLIPRIFECLPQRIDHESFSFALYMAAEAGNPFFRLGYNSFGAFDNINHLHFQVYCPPRHLLRELDKMLDLANHIPYKYVYGKTEIEKAI